MTPTKVLLLALLCSTLLGTAAVADGHTEACMTDWVFKDDRAFAEDCAAMAFDGSLEDRQRLAWMYFARMNLQVEGGTRVDKDTGTAPLWMAWPTDPETFPTSPLSRPGFEFTETRVDESLRPSVSKTVLAGTIASDTAEGAPNNSEEEVTRNQISYEYIRDNTLYTTPGVQGYINAGNRIEMPIGSIETKAKWLSVDSPDKAPEGAFVFKFTNSDTGAEGYYYWGGLHVMAKMRPTPEDVFFDNSPSWFWSTFEFKGNAGVDHVVADFITEKAPLSEGEIQDILAEAGIDGLGYEAYAPNGTQISFSTENGTPVILGHTQMEDFAGAPNSTDPEAWTAFNASCHACHATASIQPDTGEYFPFTVPIGDLSQYYTGQNSQTNFSATYALRDGFVPLDFMWPIVFRARAEH